MSLPDPALVVLVGATGAGKSTWAMERYRSQEIVSSDDLRGIVGSGRHDLDASADAFSLLDQIVTARLKRRLTTVVDTLGLDPDRRLAYVGQARARGLPAVAVVFDVPDALCRERNARRDRPVPAPALAAQVKKVRELDLADEGWDEVVRLSHDAPPVVRPESQPVGRERPESEVVLQVSRFPWGEDPAGWLKEVALAADEAGFAGLALMDHLIQIPQVGRAWEPIPEPFTTLGLLAGLDTSLSLGTLCTPISFRPAGVIAKTVATLDALSGGRAFVGIGAGWWEREHVAFGLQFPPAPDRLDGLARTIETMRALWSTGTKAYVGERVQLPETTCYPRPLGELPRVVVGGGGERRTLRIAAELGDACNLRTGPAMAHKMAVFDTHRRRYGSTAEVTVLDLPVVGRDRDDVWRRVELLRGNTPAATYAARHQAATVEQTAIRYRGLFELGISTIFVAVPDLAGPDDVLALAGLTKSS